MLTHGHEDHIGATPYLLREREDIPLVGSELTLALLGSKLREHRLKETVHHMVREGDRITFGPFDLEFVAVNHSIPDALAVAIRTGAGLVLHTGDFKMDQLPLDGRITDLRAFARLGEEGVDLFLTDSTNAEVPGFTTPGDDISPVLDRVFHEPGSGSSWPASPPTCTGSSRSSTPRSSTPQGRLRRPLDGPQHGRSPATWATSRCRPASWSTSRTSPTSRPRSRC